jgi:Protein of unknown function (DUF3102)
MNDLANFASQIRLKHEQATEAAGTAIRLATEAGDLLIKAKEQVQHGSWGAWVQENCRFSERTARGYMRLARELPKLEESKRQRVADMSLREAIRAVAAPNDDQHKSSVAWFRLVADINAAVADWNWSTDVLTGQVEGDLDQAAYLGHAALQKCRDRITIYEGILSSLESGGMAPDSKHYRLAKQAVDVAREMAAEYAA